MAYKLKHKNSAKRALLKKIISGKGTSVKLNGGLGNSPLNPGSGGGVNLGTNGIF